MAKTRIDGIDLSHYQSGLNIDWNDAKKAGVKFVIHKASEGTGWTDPAYKARRTEVGKQGLTFGAYHFAHPAPGTAEAEARHYLATADLKSGDMVPILDLEVNEHNMSIDALTLWVHTWFEHVYAVLGFKTGLLYTHINLASVPRGVRLWVPRYSNSNASPVIPRPFHTWTMWQFTDGHYGTPSVVPGVGRVDANYLRQTFWWNRLPSLTLPVTSQRKATAPTPKPAPKPAPKKPAPNLIANAVKIARAQVGYHEGRSNGHWDNHQKFSPAVPGLEWSQNQPWCATFVSWVAMKSGLSSYYPRTASCKTAMAWWKAKGQWSEYPAIGAQVIYGGGVHTGLVYDYDDTYVYTVEGNTNTNGSAEGDGVYLKKRRRRDTYVTGYGYPAVPGGLKSADPSYKRK